MRGRLISTGKTTKGNVFLESNIYIYALIRIAVVFPSGCVLVHSILSESVGSGFILCSHARLSWSPDYSKPLLASVDWRILSI